MPQRKQIGVDNDDFVGAIPAGSLSIDYGDESEESDDEQTRLQDVNAMDHWRNSPFAVGLTHTDWLAERQLNPKDDTACLCASGWICGYLGAGRVGNMSVLYQRNDPDRRPQLVVVVGPYWPMLLLVTYPLIIGVSIWTYHSGIRNHDKSFGLVVSWFLLTLGLIVALALTAFRDPGILYRTPDPPDDTWRWCDAADSYRPRDAWFDTDTQVVVRGFDHTCPWTGTAIGANNMLSFQFFVCLVFVCMVMDIFIMTGAV